MTTKLERWCGVLLAYGSLFCAVYGVGVVLYGGVYLNPLAVLGGLIMSVPYLAYRTRKDGVTTIPYQHKLS